MLPIKIKKLSDTAIIPSKGSNSAAGFDLYADIQGIETILAHHTSKIPTNIALEIPEGFYGAIYARSGIASKKGLRPCNCVGIIDSDYRGNIIVALHNDTNISKNIEPNERIAQLVIQPCFDIKFEEVEELSDTKRGEGGFGSTGR